MYFSNSDIKADLLDAFDEISGAAYPENLLTERADGYVPVYYHQILADWQEMPNDFTDSWRELGADPDKGIFSLMSVDLFAYYENETLRVWAEIVQDKDQEQAGE